MDGVDLPTKVPVNSYIMLQACFLFAKISILINITVNMLGANLASSSSLPNMVISGTKNQDGDNQHANTWLQNNGCILLSGYGKAKWRRFIPVEVAHSKKA